MKLLGWMVLATLGISLRADAPGDRPSPPQSPWSLGLTYQGADFSGNYYHLDGVNLTSYDTSGDLGLAPSAKGLGLGLDYEGRRFRLQLSTWGQAYAGDRQVVQDVTIDGKVYQAGARVQSRISLRSSELDWTIKLFRSQEGYFGLDFGLSSWSIDLTAQGQGSVAGGPVQSAFASASGKQIIPQAGLSAGYRFGPVAELRGYYHLLSRRGADYRRAGADLRYFPLPWLGLRLALERERFDLPKGSLDDRTALKIDKNGAGFGVIWRF